jgi:hypothetical protein
MFGPSESPSKALWDEAVGTIVVDGQKAINFPLLSMLKNTEKLATDAPR